MRFPKINGKQLTAKNKLKFAYIRNCAEESLDFDNDEQSLGLSEKTIKLLSWNVATNVLSGMLKEFNHLRSSMNCTHENLAIRAGHIVCDDCGAIAPGT